MSATDIISKVLKDIKAPDLSMLESVNEVGGKVKEYGVKFAKTVSGVQAYQDRKKALSTKELADNIVAETKQKAESLQEESSKAVEAFGKYRCESLKNTVGRFLQYLKYLDKNANDKEYAVYKDVTFQSEEIKRLENIEMSASNALETAAISGSVAAVALTGVPTAVTGAVAALATASTGTAISSLSGAAAQNAVLAWLGGGAVAAGGGGVALGATVLTAITYASTGIFALAAVGTIASTFYSKKYTEATKYLSEVQVWQAKVDSACVVMQGIIDRCNELFDVTKELEKRVCEILDLLEPLVYDMDTADKYQLEVMQNAMMFIKSMSELSQTPILDKEGNLSEESGVELDNVQKLLSREL